MKIGIMSMQNVNNIGSLLQAYALGKYCGLFGEVKYLNLLKSSEDANVFVDILDYDSLEREGGMSKLKKVDRYFFNRLINKKSVKKQNQIFEIFRQQHFKQADRNEKCDLCIIGSDEVFNCLQQSPWGFTSRLFGNVSEANTVISYAASCGFTTYEKCNEMVKSAIKDSLRKMSAISVRDKNTFEFIHKMGIDESEISINLDPVLVFDFTEEMRENDVSVPENMCIIYSYHNRIKDPAEIAQIKRFCKKNGLKPVAIGESQAWIGDMLCLNPFEVLVAFSKAKFIITDTFHGTIMAAKYNGHFAIIVRESNSNKVSDLVNRIDIKSHVISSWEQLQDIFSLESCKDEVNVLLKDELEKTKEYLRSFLIEREC